MFGQQISAARSIRKIDEGLYFMEYKGDYGMDKFLEQGGISNPKELEFFLIDYFFYGLIEARNESKTEVPAFGCSAISVKAKKDSSYFMGRNFDWWDTDPHAMIIHTIPTGDYYESYSTCALHFVFGNEWVPDASMETRMMAITTIYVPLDGINEKGLCIADLTAGDNEATIQSGKKLNLTTTSAIRVILDKAATVDEAIVLLENANMHSDIGFAHHLAISDATGKSVVVEYDNNKLCVTPTAFVTNHYICKPEKNKNIDCENSNERFKTLEQEFSSYGGRMSSDEVLKSLKAVSNIGTRWSIVYDRNNFAFDFYWEKNYDRPAFSKK